MIVNENFSREKWQQKISDDLVEKCISEVESEDDFELDNFGFKCNTKMARFSYCMWREITLNCPEESQQNSRQCQRLRSVLN